MVQLLDSTPATPTSEPHREDARPGRYARVAAQPPTVGSGDAARPTVGDHAQPRAAAGARVETELGVIEEARRRQRRRRLSILLALSLLAGLAAGIFLGAGASAGAPSVPAHGRPAPKFAGTSIFSMRPPQSQVALLPALGAGEVGWYDFRSEPNGSASGGCCALLTHAAQIDSESKVGGQRDWTANVLAAPHVAFVSVGGGPLVPTRSARLPYRLRSATVTSVRHLHSRVTAYNARDEVIDVPGFQTMPKRHFFEGPYAPSSWKAPASPPRGACRLSLAGLSGARAIRGATVPRVEGYRSFRPAFQSCVDTEYALGSTHLQTAILLDAEHPGSRPAALPYMQPLAGVHGVYQEPTSPISSGGRPRPPHIPRFLLARRISGGWLVVTGGKDASQSLSVLLHLHVRIHL
ncbi:MAG: hypothetical protein ACYCUM_10320 [Solirubrobacteraceae bacterium]